MSKIQYGQKNFVKRRWKIGDESIMLYFGANLRKTPQHTFLRFLDEKNIGVIHITLHRII
jgi:hypothetical protein